MSYVKQNWVNGSGGNTPITAERLAHLERGVEAPTMQPPYIPQNKMVGPAHTEVPVWTGGAALDGLFDESYLISGVLPSPWPLDAWGDMYIINNAWTACTSDSTIGCPATYRFMSDGSDLGFFAYSNFEVNFYIDGQPYANNPVLLGPTSGYAPYGFNKLVFASARPRLIEMRTMSGMVGLYTKKPYRIWKPAPDPNPKIAVVGDSFVYPIAMSDTIAGSATPDPWIRGMYQGMASELGVTSLVTDGVGGSGYLAGGGANKPYTHASRVAWLGRIKPNVIVLHGGGINDLYNSFSTSAIITAAVNHIKTLRTNHPDAKIVFVEGFTPPLFTAASYNPNFITIRQGVKAGLEAAGVSAYYLDIATTRPPLVGTGYVTAPVAGQNTSIYIGSDQAHPTVLGHRYLRSIVAGKLKQVLADRGLQQGSLIL